MNDVPQREPNDGRANLVAARLMTKERRTTDAEAYYHRAIYGEWPSDAAARRISARVELIDFLVANGEKQELLAELLPLQEEAGSNPAIEKRLAHLFLDLSRASLEQCITRHANASSNETNRKNCWSGSGSPFKQSSRWQARIKACGTITSPEEEPLRLVLERLSQ